MRSYLHPYSFCFPFHAFGPGIQALRAGIPDSQVKFKMIPVPAGTFTIGSPNQKPDETRMKALKKKYSIEAFWMGEHEVTFAEWDAFFKNMDVPQTKAIALMPCRVLPRSTLT